MRHSTKSLIRLLSLGAVAAVKFHRSSYQLHGSHIPREQDASSKQHPKLL
jgi:hypothetical protein